MTPESIMTLGQAAIKLTFFLAGPPLLATLITGLIVSLLQAATQINEQTLSFIPKIIAVALTLVLAGPWMLNQLIAYITMIFSSFPHWVN